MRPWYLPNGIATVSNFFSSSGFIPGLLSPLDANNLTYCVQIQPQPSIARFLIALAAGTFHDAFQKGHIDQQAIRVTLKDFVGNRVADDPTILSTKGAELITRFQYLGDS